MVIPAHGSGELRHSRQSWNQRGFICGSIEPTNRLRSWLCSTLLSLVWGSAHSSLCCPASPLPVLRKNSVRPLDVTHCYILNRLKPQLRFLVSQRSKSVRPTRAKCQGVTSPRLIITDAE